MRMFTRFLAVALIAANGSLVAKPSPLPLTPKPQPTRPDITAADLMTRLFIFAADSMLGREAGMPGNVKGTNYIAAEIKRLGLVRAGDSGTYFQTIPLKTREFDTTSTFAVGGAPLTAFTDYIPNGRVPLTNAAVPIVYGGDLADTAHQIAADQATGKLVVFGAKAGLVGRRVRFPTLPGAAGLAPVRLGSPPPPFMALSPRPHTLVVAAPPGPPPPAP